MSRSPITIIDIARAAGVSIATVSRVLNNRGGKISISEATKARVSRVATELGYEANPFAAGLRSGFSGVIGAIVREISDPFLTELTRAVERATWDHGWNILVGHSQFDDARTRRHVDYMLNGLFDGLVLIGNLVDAQELLSRVGERQLPAVSIDAGTGINIPAIEVDNESGVSSAIEHLLALGHRRIGFLGSLELPGIKARLETMRRVLASRDVPLPPDLVCPTPNYRSQAIETATSLLSLPNPPTAIVCSSDNLALGVISAAWRSNLSVPDDLSVVGFDDIPEASMSYPPLTSVRQPVDKMAQLAIGILQRVIDGNRRNRAVTTVEPELIQRGTTAAPRSI